MRYRLLSSNTMGITRSTSNRVEPTAKRGDERPGRTRLSPTPLAPGSSLGGWPRPRVLRRPIEKVQVDGVAVVRHGPRRSSASMAHHVGVWVRQQFEVCPAPFGERAHCFTRPLGMAADILS